MNGRHMELWVQIIAKFVSINVRFVRYRKNVANPDKSRNVYEFLYISISMFACPHFFIITTDIGILKTNDQLNEVCLSVCSARELLAQIELCQQYKEKHTT